MTTEQPQHETAPAATHRRVIDGGEVFEADDLETLADKLADAKGHATKKIREQEAELREWRAKGEKNETVEAFVAAHGDYQNDGAAGDKNGELMRMKLAELGLPVTSENLSKAYSHLKQSGLLTLKGEEAHSDTDDKTKEPERIAQAKVEPTPQRTNKTSGISTQSRPSAVPQNTEPSEDDAYSMPLDKLRQLSNKQMAAR